MQGPQPRHAAQWSARHGTVGRDVLADEMLRDPIPVLRGADTDAARDGRSVTLNPSTAHVEGGADLESL